MSLPVVLGTCSNHMICLICYCNALILCFLATGGYDHKIRFWDASNGTCMKTIVFGESQVNCMQISPNKALLIAGKDSLSMFVFIFMCRVFFLSGGNPHMHMFDINSSEEKPFISYEGHTNNITSIGFHRHLNWLYSASEDGTVRIWDPRASASTRTYDCGAPVNTAALSPNQVELITGDQNGFVKVWDLVADKCRQEYLPLADVAVRSIAIVSIGHILTTYLHGY